MKKLLSVLLASLVILSFAACTKKPAGGASSVIASSETAVSEQGSSKVTTLSSKEVTESEQSSKQSSKQYYPIRIPDRDGSWEHYYEESKTESESVKIYKNNGTLQIGAYGFGLTKCNANGDDEESRLAEYTDVINEKYFNTYFVSSDANVLTQVEQIAKSGGTYWLHVGNYREKRDGIERYMEDAEFYVELLTKYGYGEILNGFYWDEPVWNGMTNDEFLTMTSSLYKKFGLRIFPVFATGEFSGLEGNEIGVEADEMNKVLTESLKYVTDVAFDAYGVDVRDGVVPTAESLARWKEKISPNVTDSKSYYTEYKKKLVNHVAHPVNVWYYPCAYEAPVGTGLNGISRANEDYCIGHLEFMAEDIMKDEYGAGLVLYTYHTSGERYGLQRHLALKDSNGYYKYYPDEEKWDKYFATLKKICEKFNQTAVKRADIGVKK